MSWERESVRKVKKASLEYLSMRRQSWVERDNVTILGDLSSDLGGEGRADLTALSLLSLSWNICLHTTHTLSHGLEYLLPIFNIF